MILVLTAMHMHDKPHTLLRLWIELEITLRPQEGRHKVHEAYPLSTASAHHTWEVNTNDTSLVKAFQDSHSFHTDGIPYMSLWLFANLLTNNYYNTVINTTGSHNIININDKDNISSTDADMNNNNNNNNT